ncbi:hypothetical protein CRV08_09785 [Halarcobacter ebronensis]|uniref:YtxH domain-containing protein n=1 Tax=Halarcobacter ebronensis TaxID=1462615 RepID=A0A4Q0YFR6_9BACT|nr:hypothetical protein [Halarcobacter ebronensis]RXJ67651.1 hypothetical protein CRV08_09785 [Halarcobacter ebronensis]
MQDKSSLGTNPYINKAEDVNIVNQNPYINSDTTASNLLSSFDTNKFLLGAVVGAVGAYLLTNENAQKAIFKTIAKGSALFSAGIEEMKERFEDAKAEMEASQE